MRVKSVYTALEYDVIREALDSYVVLNGDGLELQVLKEHFQEIPEVRTLSEAVGDEAAARHEVAQPMTEVRIVSETGGEKGSKPQQVAQIPPAFLLALGAHYAVGNAKYPDPEPGVPNWSRGYDWSLSFNAMMRHLLAYWGGEDIDPETGSPHLIAAAWHCATLFTFGNKGLGTDDRPAY